MKIAVWKTGHEIADTVAEAVYEGLRLPARYGKCTVDQFTTTISYNPNVIETPDVHIGYGILRGMGDVFKACDKDVKPWICVDRGYFKPNHYDGYYRISLCGTQQTSGLDKLEPDYERWDELRLSIDEKPFRYLLKKKLVCPPTDYVCNYFGIHQSMWCVNNAGNTHEFEYRFKGTDLPIAWDKYEEIITFNSSVGWEALRQGIPVISDPTHSIVGAYQKLVDKSIHNDLDERRKLFAIMSGLQLTLAEIKSGLLWPVIQKLLSTYTSDMMPVKP